MESLLKYKFLGHTPKLFWGPHLHNYFFLGYLGSFTYLTYGKWHMTLPSEILWFIMGNLSLVIEPVFGTELPKPLEFPN